MPDEPYEFLRGVQLFSEVSDKDLRAIAASMRRRAFAAGEHIVSEGEGGVGFFFVESGAVAVTLGGERRATLGPGDHFGEIALLDGQPRTAEALAQSDCELMVIDRRDFIPLVKNKPEIALKLIEVLCARLRHTSEQVEDVLFLDLPARLANPQQSRNRRHLGSGIRNYSGQPSDFSENSIQSQSKNEIFRNEKGGGSKMERYASKTSNEENGTAVPFLPGVRPLPHTGLHASTRLRDLSRSSRRQSALTSVPLVA